MDKVVANKVQSFFTKFRKREFKKGDIIIQGYEIPHGVFYIAEGIVKQYSLSKEGQGQIVNLFKPCSFFPMMWAVNNIPNNYFFEALSDVEVFEAPKEKAIEFIKNNDDVIFDLLCRIYHGLEGQFNRIEYLLFGSANSKVVFTLLNFSSRFGPELHISHQDIASFSGLTRETISRELAKLREKNMVENANNLVIVKNREALEKELENN